jgi:hypothetical protein
MNNNFKDHFRSLSGDQKLRVIGMHFSKGNIKVPFYIFNMNSATDCPCLHDNRCQALGNCYAIRPENFRPSVLPYRRRQEIIWENSSPEEIAESLMIIHGRRRVEAAKVLRWSESGDFRGPKDIDKMSRLGQILIGEGWNSYGYTARTDLDLSVLMDKKIYVNVSNHDGNWKSKGANEFTMVKEPSGKNYVCKGDCRVCSVCHKARGKTIEVIEH